MPNAAINGLNFYYERAGAGPPLLFISGSGGDLRAQPNVFADQGIRCLKAEVVDYRRSNDCDAAHSNFFRISEETAGRQRELPNVEPVSHRTRNLRLGVQVS